ncbi:hypothetical protein ABRB16_005381, partial [Escherichia coli]
CHAAGHQQQKAKSGNVCPPDDVRNGGGECQNSTEQGEVTWTPEGMHLHEIISGQSDGK